MPGALTGMLATTGVVEPASVGSDRSGYGGPGGTHADQEQCHLGQHLADIKLHTDFCYNFSRVTDAHSQRSYDIYAIGGVRLALTSGRVRQTFDEQAGTPATTTPMAAATTRRRIVRVLRGVRTRLLGQR